MIVLKGKVKVGRKQGQRLGFPTINIAVSRLIKKDQWGIYFSLVKIGSKIYPGVTHLGPPKTFSLTHATCETHLFTVGGDFYGKTVEKRLILKFREVKKFDKISELKKQIKEDIKDAKKFFGL
ncbi:MAG: riboflavin kinase [Patescibacteria group bacterium]